MGNFPFGPTDLAPYADQEPALSAGLVSGAAVTSLYAAIAGRNNAKVNIPVIGDSVTEGRGATTYDDIWVQQANRAIRTIYPTTANGSSGGLGFIPLQPTGTLAFTWPVTVASGSPTPIDIGPVRYAQALFAAGSFTYTAPAATTSAKVMFYGDNSGSQFSTQVNSNPPVTYTATGQGEGALTASIPLTAGEVLTVAWVSGGIFLEGIVHYASDETSGITFHACGHQGWNAGAGTDGWNQPEQFSIDWPASYAGLSPTAIGVLLGINDANPTNGNETGPQFEAALTAFMGTTIGQQAGLTTVPQLFMIPYQPLENYADPQGWPPYPAAIRGTAAALAARVSPDLTYRMPSVASGFDSNLLYDPSQEYHPTDAGHALIGEIVAAGLRIA